MILMLRASFLIEVTVVSTLPLNIPWHALVGKTLLYTFPAAVLLSRRRTFIVILGKILSLLGILFIYTYLLFKLSSCLYLKISFIHLQSKVEERMGLWHTILLFNNNLVNIYANFNRQFISQRVLPLVGYIEQM